MVDGRHKRWWRRRDMEVEEAKEKESENEETNKMDE